MVKSYYLLLITFLALLIPLASTRQVSGWSGTYRLENESAKIWINKEDGTIDLFYNITIALISGENINFVTIGQPNGDFNISEARDQYGNKLYPLDASQGNDYKVKVPLYQSLIAGDTIWFTLLTNVAHMIVEDAQNPGNVGMQFTPSWFGADVLDLRVAIVLPSGVNSSMVKTSLNWTNTMMENDQLVVYWETQNLVPNEQYPVGVSFPKEYVQQYDKPSSGIDFSRFLPYLVPVFFVGIFVVLAIVGVAARKKQYLLPQISMETLGIKRGLTAVEASYMLDLKPTMIVTEILYSLLKKRAVWVEGTKPSIKLKIMPQFQNMIGPAETPLRHYEIDFLNSIKENGSLAEGKLAETVMALRDNVEEQMHGYCRRDTIDYYRSIVTKAWQQVEQAGTSELTSNAYDEQLLWLLLDPNVQSRTQTIFRDRAFEPNLIWFWYWYGYSHYNPHPTYRPNIENPVQAAKPPTIPGAEFANNIATSLEKTTNNIVVNIERFANSIIPAPQTKASHEPARHDASCVCACHACACVCACVSCACACAGGGVG
jgi:hypothetical protein